MTWGSGSFYSSLSDETILLISVPHVAGQVKVVMQTFVFSHAAPPERA